MFSDLTLLILQHRYAAILSIELTHSAESQICWHETLGLCLGLPWSLAVGVVGIVGLPCINGAWVVTAASTTLKPVQRADSDDSDGTSRADYINQNRFITLLQVVDTGVPLVYYRAVSKKFLHLRVSPLSVQQDTVWALLRRNWTLLSRLTFRHRFFWAYPFSF